MPLFDIKCGECGRVSEILAPDMSDIRCRCGSKDVERCWTAPPMFKMIGDPNGSTPGIRKYAMDITRKEYEKQEKEYKDSSRRNILKGKRLVGG